METQDLWVEYLGLFLTLLGAALTWVLKRVADAAINKMRASDTEKQAMQALLEGMAVAQNDVIRAAKAAAVDGKLTKDEIAAAEELALKHARTVAVGPAKDLLLAMTRERAGSYIKQLLAAVAK